MNKRMKKLWAGCTVVAAALVGGVVSLSAAQGHQVSPARTVMVNVVGSKISNARGGAKIVGNTLKATQLQVSFSCPARYRLARGRVSTAAGSTGWQKAKRGAKGIKFATVPLATNTTLRTMCPVNKKENAFREVTLELSAECLSTGGKKRVVTTQFPQMMRLDCDQLEVESIPKANTFWHTCPKGYVLKNNPRASRESSKEGWNKPRTCVKKK